MERRKAVTAAAAASLTLLAGAAGITLSSGIVDANGNDDVGQLSPVSATTNLPITVSSDDPTTTTTGPAPTVQATDKSPVTASSASAYTEAGDDDRSGDDDEHEREEGEHEYEGADDDD